MNTAIIIITIYLGIGFIFGYFFITNELPKIFNSETPDDIDKQAMKMINNGSKEVGKKTFIVLYFLILAVCWFPIIIKTAIDSVKYYFTSYHG